MKGIISKHKKKLIGLASLAVLLIIGVTYAWQKWEVDLQNVLTPHNTGVTVDETFTPGNAEGSVTKKVRFTNNGTSNVFLRITFAETWKKGEEILPNQEGIANKQWTGFFGNDNWVKGSDGWYYYKKVLPPKSSTSDILDSVIFDYSSYPEYREASYELYFQAEICQASTQSTAQNYNEVNEKATKALFGVCGQVVNENEVSWSKE